MERFSGDIVAPRLTEGSADDAGQLPQLLEGQPLAGAFVCADGVCHEAPLFEHVYSRGGTLLARSPYNAAPWPDREDEPGIAWRNLQIAKRNELGQHAWTLGSGYSHRSLIETHNARLKLYTGASMRTRIEDNQQVELLLRRQLINAYQALRRYAGGTRARAIR